jgi:hypothetical protein
MEKALNFLCHKACVPRRGTGSNISSGSWHRFYTSGVSLWVIYRAIVLRLPRKMCHVLCGAKARKSGLLLGKEAAGFLRSWRSCLDIREIKKGFPGTNFI